MAGVGGTGEAGSWRYAEGCFGRMVLGDMLRGAKGGRFMATASGRFGRMVLGDMLRGAKGGWFLAIC